LLQGLLGLAGMATALAGLRPVLQRLPRAPAPHELVHLAGPLCTLPVPFLWVQWAKARERNDPAAAAACGRMLAWLLPEREDLFVGFAWELAYEAARSAGPPTVQVEFLLDALALLERGRQLHPRSPVIARTAAFLLRDRCDIGLDPGTELAAERAAMDAAFRARTGRGALEVALDWLEDAPSEPDLSFGRDYQYTVTAQILALERQRAGDTERAALLLDRAAVTSASAEQRQRLAAFATWLRTAAPKEEPPAMLREWLRDDPILGRDAGAWVGR
jgi:hypothetical protein